MDKLKVAFVGNPNVGKTALINAIAGTKLKVGNWPGVTVEKKEATVKVDGKELYLVDLPGVYSLSPFTIEERITREFLLKERPDVIVNVVDSTNLERNLYLTTQILELGIPTVIALNVWDEFRSLGYSLNLDKFEELLGVKAVPTVATKGEGTKELLRLITQGEVSLPRPPIYSEDLEKFVKKVEPFVPKGMPKRWASLKLLEGDELIFKELSSESAKAVERVLQELEEFFGESGDSVVAEERYGFIRGVLKQTLKEPVEKKRTLTDILDAIFLNRLLGIPIFLFIMYLVFKLTFDGSGPLIDWTDGFVNDFIAKWVSAAISGFPDWLQSLIIDGIIGGVGTVLTFVPLLLFLYFFLALLEESGYMARAAFVMDRLMRVIGLPGKSFVPMIIGFGCNVPAVYATRTLENERDRKLTALLIPFMSCGARLPIYALFTAVFFKKYQAEVVFSMYIIGIVVATIVGIFLKKFFFKGSAETFVMELPPYRIPTLKMLWTSISVRLGAFLKKAGTVIAAAMVLLWTLINVPYGAPPKDTVLGKTASAIAPLFYSTGIKSWEPVAALIPGTIAKEVVVGALGQLYGVGEEGEVEEEKISFTQDLKEQVVGLVQAIKDSFVAMFGSFKTGVFEIESEEGPVTKAISKAFTPLSAFSYMVLCLLWIPCIVTLGAIYQEFGLKLTVTSIILTTLIPYSVSTILYTLGRLIGVQ
ncbi:ferrous iron transport protein B [Thermovibrio guaymasensis]|uniref:Ferrous iron transport protein B n=1 Tax=Thermovibrio guaymasensis TaxID=240167 RepID=A0A420W708_9BACT|nr:ferrous iron transport protein B [Thermovibrio guaymasensis]RKQ61856.1 ferrous iron transport protein B [Thermovibrio guaymasensis]